jgi:hypothetical protein
VGRKKSRQHVKKRFAARCLLCGDPNPPELLEAHRSKPGEKYSFRIICPACPNCHTRVHAGLIRVDGPYLSSSGWGFLVTEGGVERFVLDGPGGVLTGVSTPE